MFSMLKICPAYVSKHNSNRQKQVILLMIPTEKDGIIFSKKTIRIIKRIHKKICENKDFATL